jgi:Mrp family chromosome partitioning ATPase
MLSDPILLGEKLDGILFLVGLGKVSRDLAPQACRRIKATGVDVLGLICNQVNFPSRLNDYGYEYGYYYHYAYAGSYSKAGNRYGNYGKGPGGYMRHYRDSYMRRGARDSYIGGRYRNSYLTNRYLRDGYAVQGYQDAAAREEAGAKGKGSNGSNGSASNGAGALPGRRRANRRGPLRWLAGLPRRIPFLGRGPAEGSVANPYLGDDLPDRERPAQENGKPEAGKVDSGEC